MIMLTMQLIIDALYATLPNCRHLTHILRDKAAYCP
jgi:hypothetical protein